ncbi:MAG: PocR ligand-binding domain-containing protein [Anaerolineaceae bacterium]|nr:PocR ligand-binding domain-containing protein [Anaerolineaceae bacterium]MBN2677583.1 PocR ligand-binding domain-containing protein [Anaerolineaceae bacterium]
MDNLLTARQVQALLNVDRTTIYRMLKDGRLTGVKVGQQWRFSSREVNDFLVSGVNHPTDGLFPDPVNILPLLCMQSIQDVFAEIAEVGSIIADRDGNPITRISNSCDFCKLILGSEEGRQACINSWSKLAGQKDAAPGYLACHAGLEYARARIELKGELIAILIAGQFYCDQPDPAEQERRLILLAKKYHINLDLLGQAAQQISVLDEQMSSKISGWLERVAKTFVQVGSERADLVHRLQQIAVMSEYKA